MAAIDLNADLGETVDGVPTADDEAMFAVISSASVACGGHAGDAAAMAEAVERAARHGVAIVAPDTSPRGDGVPDDSEAAYDFGLGAGFYVNAEQAPWSRHYRMYDYVVNELPVLVCANLPLDGNRVGIFGHSMGGLVIRAATAGL